MTRSIQRHGARSPRSAAERFAEAQALAQTALIGRPIKQMPYQTIGDLMLTMPGVADESDCLCDLDGALTTPQTARVVAAGDGLLLTGQGTAAEGIAGVLHFAVKLRAIATGGRTTVANDRVQLSPPIPRPATSGCTGGSTCNWGRTRWRGPAMDQQILRDLFDQTARAAAILNIDAGFVGATVMFTRVR